MLVGGFWVGLGVEERGTQLPSPSWFRRSKLWMDGQVLRRLDGGVGRRVSACYG